MLKFRKDTAGWKRGHDSAFDISDIVRDLNEVYKRFMGIVLFRILTVIIYH